MRHSFSGEAFDLFSEWGPIAPPPQPPRDLEEDQYTISDSSFVREVSELYEPTVFNGWQRQLSRLEVRESCKEGIVDQVGATISRLSPRAMRRSSRLFAKPSPLPQGRLAEMLTQILA